LFAGTVALDGRPSGPATRQVGDAAGPKVWLQFPAMTSDLSPFVVGKLLDRSGAVKKVKIDRADGEWHSDPTPWADGTFAIMVRLLPRQNTSFDVSGELADGSTVALDPPQFSITHGTTLGEPPLSRSVGVALADNRVQVYFNRGSPLPIRRTFVLRTVETVNPDSAGHALKVPIVQGEFTLAHLCRLVGTLEIPASALTAALPAGADVEIMLELDRGGQLRARARIASIDQVFDQVALLVTPQVPLAAMDDALAKLRVRAADLSRSAFHGRSGKAAARLSAALPRLEDAQRNIAAARGGDLDAGEQARRELSDFDALLAEVEADQAWPELGQENRRELRDRGELGGGPRQRGGEIDVEQCLSRLQERVRRQGCGRGATSARRHSSPGLCRLPSPSRRLGSGVRVLCGACRREHRHSPRNRARRERAGGDPQAG
jgi:molecular chaperone DnaK